MKLQIVFWDDSFVELVLFQNNAVVKWFKHFRAINDYRQKYFHRPVKKLLKNIVKSDINDSWNQIKLTVNKLENIGFRFPLLVADEFDYNQHTLNQLHRFFTYNVLWGKDHTKENIFDKDFKLPSGMTFNDWFDIIHIINSSVHYLEKFAVPTKNKKFLIDNYKGQSDYYTDIMAFRPNVTDTGLDHWLSFDDEDQLHNFNEYMSLDLTLVTLDRSILGKCVLQSFYEDDDLNAFDCTGRIGASGGFEIELSDTRKKIYRSDKFIQWATSYGRTIESLPLEFPIGYLPNPIQQIDVLLKKIDTFKQIRFVN
jgi:hypothetical protein